MTKKRFYRDFSGEYGTSIRDKSNDDKSIFIFSIHNSEDLCDIFNELAEENKQYKKKSISLKQLYKILEENKEHFLSLSECFSEKLLIKTIFRNIDDDIESMELEE